MGPLVSEGHLTRVLTLIDDAVTEGARIARGGGRIGDEGYFLAPTIFVGVEDEMPIAQQEIFGPVLVATQFEDESTLLALANDTRYGLASLLWTRDISKAHRFAAALRAGTVLVNH